MLCVLYAVCNILALYAECHYAECRYAECLGALFTAFIFLCQWQLD